MSDPLYEQPFVAPEIAALYDCFPFESDIPFYLRLADRAGRRVLEAGCGTGRVLLPLARGGCQVVGLDASPAMVRLCNEKLEHEAKEVRLRTQVIEADMRDFDADGPFDLAFVAVKSFAYLQTAADQLAALHSLGRHLRPGGLLALDLLQPSPAWLAEPVGSLRQDLSRQLPDGTVLVRTEAVVGTDLAAQVKVIRSAYELIAPDGTVTKQLVEWPYRFTFRYEVEHLLARAGFTVDGVYGGYEGEPLTSASTAMLFVGRRTGKAPEGPPTRTSSRRPW